MRFRSIVASASKCPSSSAEARHQAAQHVAGRSPACRLGRQLHMPDALGGGFYLYFDVVAEPVQAVHELAFGYVREVTAEQTGHLGLRQSHAPTPSFFLQA